MDTENFGKRVELLRKNAGISQKDFAGVVGITASMLVKIENGDTSVDFELMKRISRALRCDISWLILGDETGITYR